MHVKDPLTPTEALLLGITARSMSGALLIPITVVKTRFEVREIIINIFTFFI